MYFAAALLAFAACSKEVEVAVEDTAAVSTYPVSIRAGFADETKTLYEGEKTFSWVAGDKIAMMVTNNETGVPDVITLTAEADGPVTTFTGNCPKDYSLADYAFYPKGTGDTSYSSDLGKVVDTENKKMNLRMWGTITPDLNNPMASIPLIGKMDSYGFVQFKTATGILKVTVSGIPADAYFLQLNLDNGIVALNGNYSFGEDCTIYMKNVIGTAWGQKYVYFTPAEAGETRSFYLPIPVGTIPAGLKVSLATNSGNILLAETKEAIEIKRNTIVNTPALAVPEDEYKTIGTGKFKDKFIWGFAGLTDYAEVEFQQNARFQNKYRLVKPYPGENSGEFFYFDITNYAKVACDPYFVDLEVTASGKATYKPWVGTYYLSSTEYSKVLYTQENGLPGSLQLAPCYRGEEFSAGGSADYNYEIGKDHENLAIEIVFPGCEPYEVHGPDLEPDQIWIKPSEITVNSDAGSLDGSSHYDGIGALGLVDDNTQTFWHSAWKSGDAANYDVTKDFDAKYGITIDIALREELKDFSISYYTRHNNNNGEPREIILACSNDGTAWTDIQTIADDDLMKVAAGARVDLPAVSATAAFKYLRIGITKAGNGDTPNNLTAGGASTALGELLLFNAANAEPPQPTNVDVLNNAFTGVDNSSSSYQSWADKAGVTGAVYAGNTARGSAADNLSVQLRAKGAEGIVSTTSAGLFKKVEITFNSSSTAGRLIDIFGSNTPYTSPKDLYDYAKRGTLITSLVCDASNRTVSYEVSGDYAYIGIRSHKDAQYLDEIKITWEEGTPATTTSSYVWDFASAEWQAKFAEVAAVNTEVNGWNIIYDGLQLVSNTDKSKYWENCFQMVGKAVAVENLIVDRYFTFTAPKDGYVLVLASNTGETADETRLVTLQNEGTKLEQVGGVSSLTPVNLIYEVKAGNVTIYPTGGGLRFYKILFSETDPTPEEPGSGVPDYDPITGFEW